MVLHCLGNGVSCWLTFGYKRDMTSPTKIAVPLFELFKSFVDDVQPLDEPDEDEPVEFIEQLVSILVSLFACGNAELLILLEAKLEDKDRSGVDIVDWVIVFANELGNEEDNGRDDVGDEEDDEAVVVGGGGGGGG